MQDLRILAIAFLAISMCGCILVHPGIVHVKNNFTHAAIENVTVYVSKGSQDNVTVIESSREDVEVEIDSTYEKGKNPDTIGDVVTFSTNDSGLSIYVNMTKLAEGQGIQKYSAIADVYLPDNTSYKVIKVEDRSAFPP